MLPTDELMREHRLIERMFKLMWTGCNSLERGEPVSPEFFADAADFATAFIEGCHHLKEETYLFAKMAERGVPEASGPLKIMIFEHREGRSRSVAIASLAKQPFTDKVKADIVRLSREYVNVLVPHIQKEDSVLFPLANDILSQADQDAVSRGFTQLDESFGGGAFRRQFESNIEGWEHRRGIV
jgi:hemerythrin-like domain-containing protein